MMNRNQIEIVRDGMHSMHGLLDRAVEQMDAEQWNHRSADGGVSAFFSLWHYVRSEDNIANFVAQRRNTVWLRDGWDQRFGLHRTSQGTGMTSEQANAVLISDVEGWLAYQQGVWIATDQWLDTLSPEMLEDPIVIKPVPAMTLWQALTGMLLYHGYRHVGEIEHARGLVGLPGLTI